MFLLTGGSKYLKKKSTIDQVPDLDDMGGDDGDLMNGGGTSELVYDMDKLGL